MRSKQRTSQRRRKSILKQDEQKRKLRENSIKHLEDKNQQEWRK